MKNRCVLIKKRSVLSMNKVEELFKSTKLDEVLKKRDKEKTRKTILIILAIVGGVVVVAGIAYAVYRYFAAKEMEELEAEFADEFDEDFFDEDDDIIVDDVFDEV